MAWYVPGLSVFLISRNDCSADPGRNPRKVWNCFLFGGLVIFMDSSVRKSGTVISWKPLFV